MENELRPFWGKYFTFRWKFGLALLAVVCIPRFLLVLQANKSENYGPIGAIMFVSAIVPFIFLSKYGRKEIGIKTSAKWRAIIFSFVLGVIMALFLYFVGVALYGDTYQNWYQYIGKSYNIPALISEKGKLLLFAAMAVSGMIFSPIGEELFFRGIVHSSFAKSVGETKASIIDSVAFAFTHIAHFGLIYLNGTWEFYPVPTLIWVAGMFVSSMVFFKMKESAGSLLGAIVCHAGFNLGMIYSIFYWL